MLTLKCLSDIRSSLRSLMTVRPLYYIATTVLTSDNATIAAPAAAVFVTVGEETVKVVVK
jgi:hypothetical protein